MSSRPDTNVMHHSISALLTDDELAQLNAKRPPRDKIKPTKLCGARTSTDGSPCQDKAGAKTKHKGWGYCAQHGGNTPAGNRYAARLMGEDILEKQRHRIEKFGGDRNDPSIRNLTGEQVLIEEVRRSAAMVRWLEDRIGEWDFNSDQQARFEEYSDALGNMSDRDLQQIDNLRGLPALVTETSRGIATTTDQAEWLRIYRDERINLAKIAKMCIDAGIAYRMVAIAEDQGRVLSSAMRAVIDLLNLNQQQLDRIPQIVPPILRAVASGEPIPSREQLGLPA